MQALSSSSSPREEVERRFQLFDCGVLQRFSRSSPKEIRQTMVVLYAPIFEGINRSSDYTTDQTISFIDSNGVQRHFTTKKPRGTKHTDVIEM